MRRFGGVVERVLRNFDGQVLGPDLGLTAQARLGFQPPSPVKIVFFQIIGLFQRVETFANQAVAGGTGADATTGTFHFDMVLMGQFEDRDPRLSLHDQAVRAKLLVWQKNYLRHRYSPISFRLRPARAALTVESRRRAAKASVTCDRRLVCCSMAKPSVPFISSVSSCTCISMTIRSSASSRRSPSTSRAPCTASIRRWASTCCSRNTRATLSSLACWNESFSILAISPSVRP